MCVPSLFGGSDVSYLKWLPLSLCVICHFITTQSIKSFNLHCQGLPKMCFPFQFGGSNLQSTYPFFVSRLSLDLGNLNFRETSNNSSALQDEVCQS